MGDRACPPGTGVRTSDRAPPFRTAPTGDRARSGSGADRPRARRPQCGCAARRRRTPAPPPARTVLRPRRPPPTTSSRRRPGLRMRLRQVVQIARAGRGGVGIAHVDTDRGGGAQGAGGRGGGGSGAGAEYGRGGEHLDVVRGQIGAPDHLLLTHVMPFDGAAGRGGGGRGGRHPLFDPGPADLGGAQVVHGDAVVEPFAGLGVVGAVGHRHRDRDGGRCLRGGRGGGRTGERGGAQQRADNGGSHAVIRAPRPPSPAAGGLLPGPGSPE